MTTARTFLVRAAFGVASVAAIANANGCGSAPNESAESASSAVTTCSQPFEVDECRIICLDPPIGGGSGGHVQGNRPETCTRTCACDSVVGPAAFEEGSVKVSLSCFAASGVEQIAPAGPAGCTLGARIARQDGSVQSDGTMFANTWACPIGTPIPANLGAAVTCEINPLAGTGTTPAHPGASECEWIYSGTTLSTGSDCIGSADSGYILLQERVFTTTPQPPPGHTKINGACSGGCEVPE